MRRAARGTPGGALRACGGGRPTKLVELLFGAMGATAAASGGGASKEVVLAVPLDCGEPQKAALRAAAEGAGLVIKQFVPEPVAAALAYGIGQSDEEAARDHTVLVYDLGQSRAVATVVEAREGIYRVAGSVADDTLGGHTFDEAFVKFLVKEFKKTAKVDISGEPRAIAKLKNAAEEAKKVLASNAATTVTVESLFEGVDFNCKVLRSKFDLTLGSTYRKCTAPITAVLEQLSLSPGDCTAVVVVGGAAKLPKVQSTIATYFDNREGLVRASIAADEAFAIGAAVQAAVLSTVDDPTDVPAELKVCPHDVTFTGPDGQETTAVSAGTPIPLLRTFVVRTAEDGATAAKVAFHERSGAGAEPALVAEAVLDGLPSAPAGELGIELSFEISKGGILRLALTEPTSGATVSGNAGQ